MNEVYLFSNNMTSEVFTKTIGATIAKGFVTAGLALGTKLGLFKGLADLAQSKETSVTTQQLADSLNYKERYVREWINGMVCGDVVDHEEIDSVDRYWLEPFRLPALLGDKMQWSGTYGEGVVAFMLQIPDVEKCFPINGPLGTQMSDYSRLQQFREKDGIWFNEPEHCRSFLDDPDLHSKLEKGINVIEIGCGTAGHTKALASSFPKSTFVASDLQQSAIEKAQRNAQDLPNVSYQVLDACNLPEKMMEHFDLAILFEVYHEVPQPQQIINGVLRLLKKGGQLIMSEHDMHERVADNKKYKATLGSILYMTSTLYCVPTCISTLGGEGLGACAGKELYERRLKKDFSKVERIGEKHGLYFLCTK